MTIKCPIIIPSPETAKTPKEIIGLENAEKFEAHI